MNYSIWKNMKLSMIMLGLFILQCDAMNSDNGIVEATRNRVESESNSYSVRFIFPPPEWSSKKVVYYNESNIMDFLSKAVSVDDIPLRMYDHILGALDSPNDTESKKIAIALLKLYAVNVDSFVKFDESVKCLMKPLSIAFKKAKESKKI